MEQTQVEEQSSPMIETSEPRKSNGFWVPITS